MSDDDTLTLSRPTGFDGSGGRGRKARRTPKGRQFEPTALEDIQALLIDRPRRRDLLIEYLHLIQDKYGHLSAAHLAALAHEMKMALAEVYEVATFYAHFDVVKEGEIPPPAVTVRVCDSLSCAMAGSERLLDELKTKLGKDVRVIRAPCMGACDVAPVVAVGHGEERVAGVAVRHGDRDPGENAAARVLDHAGEGGFLGHARRRWQRQQGEHDEQPSHASTPHRCTSSRL